MHRFYNQVTWKNRVAFLSGTRSTYDQLIDVGKRLKAIQHILDDLRAEKVPDNDPQMIQARELQDKILHNFQSAVRETFTMLWYPTESALMSADFRMQFEGNRYSGEQQVLNLLKEKMKFTDDVSGETFRKKCERRLFTQQSMPWSEIKRRAATNPIWQWHRTDALDALKAECLHKDLWREEGGFVDKGPFPQPKTSVSIISQFRNDDTGEVTLRVTPIHGDTVYYEFGGKATTASARLEGSSLKVKDLEVSFIAVDTTGIHETGEAVTWKNRITLKHRIYQRGKDKVIELRAAPPANIYYTTDGSDPKLAGATYHEPFIIPHGSPMVLAYAERDGIQSAVERISISWERDEEVKIEPGLPITFIRKHSKPSTKETYELLDQLKKYQAKIMGLTITIGGEGGVKEWLELTTYEDKQIAPELIEEALGCLRKIQTEGQVKLTAEKLFFNTGQDLLEWVELIKTTLRPEEIKQ